MLTYNCTYKLRLLRISDFVCTKAWNVIVMCSINVVNTYVMHISIGVPNSIQYSLSSLVFPPWGYEQFICDNP